MLSYASSLPAGRKPCKAIAHLLFTPALSVSLACTLFAISRIHISCGVVESFNGSGTGHAADASRVSHLQFAGNADGCP